MKEKKVIHNGKEFIYDEKTGKWKTIDPETQFVSWANDSLSTVLSKKAEMPVGDKKQVQKSPTKEGAKASLPNKGTYVYHNGKWMHKSGDGYDFEANETNARILEEKVQSGDYETWDNEKGGYVKGQPIKRSAEDVKKGGGFRLGLQQKEEAPKVAEAEVIKNAPPAKTALAEKQVSGTGKPVTKTSLTRELQTETGVTPVNSALPKQEIATPLAKSSMADYFDMDSALAYNKATPVKEGVDMGKLSSFAEYMPDVFKGVLGLYGASQKLPEFETPQYFTDYERRLKELSTQGLTDVEMATAKRDLDRAYAYDVNNIERFAGGRSGVALANLGRAANTFQGNTNALNVADAQMQRQNLAQYGGVVGTRLGLDQSAFNLKYQEAAQNKMAGAQLAADAFSNIQSRADYNKAYGEGSVYQQYQTSLLQGQEYLNDIYKYQTENPVELPTYNPTIMPQGIPQYQNMYINPNGN